VEHKDELPPYWVDIKEKIDDKLEIVTEKCKIVLISNKLRT